MLHFPTECSNERTWWRSVLACGFCSTPLSSAAVQHGSCRYLSSHSTGVCLPFPACCVVGVSSKILHKMVKESVTGPSSSTLATNRMFRCVVAHLLLKLGMSL